MRYYVAEGSYVWQLESTKPKDNPICLFKLEDPELAQSIADALMRTYIDGFEAGVWA